MNSRFLLILLTTTVICTGITGEAIPSLDNDHDAATVDYVIDSTTLSTSTDATTTTMDALSTTKTSSFPEKTNGHTGNGNGHTGNGKPKSNGNTIHSHVSLADGQKVSRYINRELSWLAFNERVLAEAESLRYPLLERVRFLSISHSNLDEFYMVRVGGINQLVTSSVTSRSADGLTPIQQLTTIRETCSQLQSEQQKVWYKLRQELSEKVGIVVVNISDILENDKQYLESYFLENMWSLLTPQSIDPAHPFPFIPGKGMGLLFTLQQKQQHHHFSAAGGSDSDYPDNNHNNHDGILSAESDHSFEHTDVRKSKKNKRNHRIDNSHYENNHNGNSNGNGNNKERTTNSMNGIPGELKAILLFPTSMSRFIRLPSSYDNVNSNNSPMNLSASSRASAGAMKYNNNKGPSLIRFVLAEDVIQMFLFHFFPDFHVKEVGMFRVLRDSEVEIDEEAVDLVRMFETALKRRRKGVVIHLAVNAAMPKEMVTFLSKKVDVPVELVTVVDHVVGLADIKQLIVNDRKEYQFQPFMVRFPERIGVDFGGDIFSAIRQKDLIVHHPYESFDVVLQFVRAAARDPNVVTIKQTLYRTSDDSPIVRELIEAAESGKTVTALIELKARFDEEANIRWARDMQRAGVHVVYGFVELKTHAKVALVVRRENGGLRSYVHVGTGNYHPITAKIYTDLSFFSSDPALCRDAARLFNYMTGYGKPQTLELIAIAPITLRSRLEELIYNEIANAQKGLPAFIWAKVNALVDTPIIELLYEASEAGVQIDVVVRGMCALRPGVPGLSSNIRVKSVIGRFLEHSRIVVFGNGYELPSENAVVYISSADWMTRNLDWRVEALVPIVNSTTHSQVLDEIMVHTMKDIANSWFLLPEGEYIRMEEYLRNQNALPDDYYLSSESSSSSPSISNGNGNHNPPSQSPSPSDNDDDENEINDEYNLHQYFMTHPSLSGRGKSKSGEIISSRTRRETDI